jgi:hypothetical protein
MFRLMRSIIMLNDTQVRACVNTKGPGKTSQAAVYANSAHVQAHAQHHHAQ